MPLTEITLEDMLNARDQRVERQCALIAEHGLPLMSFTMNIPGSIKKTPLTVLAFYEGLRLLHKKLLNHIVSEELVDAATGMEARLVVNLPAERIKAIATEIEENSACGRLFDMDVIDTNGEKLSRDGVRRCIVCDKPVFDCARSRAHGLDAVQTAIRAVLVSYAVKRFARLASQSLIEEACFTPKPGLVDQNNSGSHKDMDCAFMEFSANSVYPFFCDFVQAGIDNKPIEQYRAIGLSAEQRMLGATQGVNTHRGAIYCMGLALSAIGLLLGGHRELGDDMRLTAERVTAVAAELARGLYEARHQHSNHREEQRHGDFVRKNHPTAGAPEEAMAGFPHALRCYTLLPKEADSLHAIKHRDPIPPSVHVQTLTALLTLISETEDSCVLWRGGREGLDFLQSEARRILTLPADMRVAATEALDADCIRRNLSPGGCADLFALALFLQFIENPELSMADLC